MIKIYDTNHRFLSLLDSSCRRPTITDTLELGIRELSFEVPCKEEYFPIIQEENYVETADYSYIIKEVNMTGNDFISVFCGPNIEAISGKVIEHFDVFQMSPQQAYEYCLQDTGWTVNFQSKDKTALTYQEPYKEAYEMIKTITADQGYNFWFDTKNKVLNIYDKKGKELGAYFSNELKLRQLLKSSSSYDYATVVYPIGKDNLTIKDINNGRTYLTNFSYSSKYIETVKFWEDIDVPELLKMKGEEYLQEVCVPRASYEIKLMGLDKDVEVGDSIIIVDKIKHIKQKQRVVKITRYPHAPEDDSLEVSNLQPDFIDDYLKGSKETKKELTYLKKCYQSLLAEVPKNGEETS